MPAFQPHAFQSVAFDTAPPISTFSNWVALADRATQSLLGGVTATYAPTAGAPVPVAGMFDANYVFVQRDDNGTEQVGPAFFVRLEDLPLHPDDDDPILTINGTDYHVRERQTDGSTGGGIVLLLHVVT